MKEEVEQLLGDNHPIPSELINNIDIIATTKTNDIDLVIVVAGYLDNSKYTEQRILQKINTYLHFINDSDFSEEFGQPSSDKVNIILSCSKAPHRNVYELIQSIQDQVHSNNASIRIKTE